MIISSFSDKITRDFNKIFQFSQVCESVKSTEYSRPWIIAESLIKCITKFGVGTEKHMSTGVYPINADKYESEVSYLFINIDVDGYEPFTTYQDAKTAINNLEWCEVDINTVLCNYTGGNGFHIRIPAGVFGNPIFSCKDEANFVIKNTIEKILDIKTDPAPANPIKLLRMAGSSRKSVDFGDKNLLHCNSYTGADFIKTPPDRIIVDSVNHKSFQISFDPRSIQPSHQIIEIMLDTYKKYRSNKLIRDFDSVQSWEYRDPNSSNGIVGTAMNGCSEGQMWADGYVGRNSLLFIASFGVIRKSDFDVSESLSQLRMVNQRCTPPMKEIELKNIFKSAYCILTGKRLSYISLQ